MTRPDSLRALAQAFEARAALHRRMAETLPERLLAVAECLIRCLKGGGKVLFCGNGGSAADSQHLAAELVGRFERERQGIPAIALTTDTSILTSVGNDYGFERLFVRQVEAIGRPGDVLVGISTSGRSQNVILAVERAKALGLLTVALCGAEPGPLGEIADLCIAVPADRTALVQEGHIVVGHMLCGLIEAALANDRADSIPGRVEGGPKLSAKEGEGCLDS